MSDGSTFICIATAADRDRIIPVVNAAFAVEDFFEVPRTDQQDMAELMQTGTFLILEDDTVLKDEVGRVNASIYVELRGERGYFGMLARRPNRSVFATKTLLLRCRLLKMGQNLQRPKCARGWHMSSLLEF